MELKQVAVNEQSSIRIEGTKVLYFDPFQVKEAKHDADMIFITHDHYDHFEPDSIAKVKNETTFLIAPESMKKKVLSVSGMASDRCLFCGPGEAHEAGGVVIKAVWAYNKLKPFHPKGKKWLGYVVKMDNVRYYIAGDTDVNEDMLKVRCDVAIVPIGGHYTMDRKQAAGYIAALKPKAAIPTHYGDIVGRKTDGVDFKDELAKMDKEIQVELRL